MQDSEFYCDSNLLVLHVGVSRVQRWFGDMTRFTRIHLILLRILFRGDPVEAKNGGYLVAELAYGNHPSALDHLQAIYDQLMQDVVHGRPLVSALSSASEICPLHVSPFGVAGPKCGLFTMPLLWFVLSQSK